MIGKITQKYLTEHRDDLNNFMLSYVSNLEQINEKNPEAAKAIINEIENQKTHLKLIASENYSKPECHLSMGTLFTDKYAEGYSEHRYYGGCENVDDIETKAVEKAKELFGADHAYVQPHSGSDANLCAYWAILNAKVLEKKFKELKDSCNLSYSHKEVKTYDDLNKSEWEFLRISCHNQKLLAMDYYSGSHLTHGYRQNISAQLFDCYYYSVNEDGFLDYDSIEKYACEIKPLILLAGYSAYPRKIDFKRFREIADKCGAVLMVDMAHFAGLVAGKVFTDNYDPVKWADIVTTTTHKTLRGPRGGLILCKEWLKDSVNKGCPLVMGGPLPHVMTAKLIALNEANTESFSEYAKNIVENSSVLANKIIDLGGELQTKGTDNHLMLIKTNSFGITGKQAESVLGKCGIIVNRNAIPNDPNGPWYTSGIRIGTAAITTLGMGKKEMIEIASIIMNVLNNTKPEIKNGKQSKTKIKVCPLIIKDAKLRVKSILSKFELYSELNLEFLKEAFNI